MERGYWRGYAPYPYWRSARPNDGWRAGYNHRYNYPNAWVPPQVRPPAAGQLVRGPLLQLDNRFPPAFGPQPARQSTRRAQQRQTRNRWARSEELPAGDHAAGPSSAGLGRHATHSVRYVSDGQQRQVELKVPLLRIPRLCQPEEKGSGEKMAVSESPGQVPDESNAVASKDEQAPKAAEKPRASKASVPRAAEAISGGMPAPSSKAPEANSSNVVASKDECAVLKKAKVHTAVGPKPVSMTESPPSEPMPTQANGKAVLELPSQVSNAEANPSSGVATKPTNYGASSVANSKPVPESKKSPSQTSNAKVNPSTAVAKKTNHAAKKPKLEASLVASSKKPEACPSNAVPKNTARAPRSTEPKAFSAAGSSKPIPTRVSQTGQPTVPQGSSVPDAKPIPVRVSQGSAHAHHASWTPHKPAPSQEKQSTGDEFYEDVSDVPLEEYCDDPSNEASQVERVLGAGREEPQQPSRDKGVATQLGDFEDVSDTPRTLYHSPQKSGTPVKPASEGSAKKPLGKKKVIGSAAAVKKGGEKKGAKAVEARHLPLQVAAKSRPVATNKVKAHLAEKQGAAKLTATATAPNSNLGATKRLLEPPGTPHQDARKRKVDTSSEKSKPDPCASTTQQNSSPSPGKKLAAKKTKKVVSCTKVSAKLPIAGSDDAEALNHSAMLAPSTPQQKGSSLAVKKTEKVASCSKVSTKPAMASSNSKDTSKDSPMPAPKLEASKAVVAKSKKSEPTSTRTQPKTDAGHSSVTTPTHKKCPAKRKSASPRKATKSGKSTSPGKAAAVNKNPPTCAAPKGKSHAPMSKGSPNPVGQTEASAQRPPSSKATAKCHALSSEATSTKECSAMPAQHNVMPKVPETQLGKDDPAQKSGCSSTAEAAPVCAPSSDARPGSSLTQCHASKSKESSSEAAEMHQSLLSRPAVTPSKRETEAKGTPGLVTGGQPRYISEKPADGMKEQMTTPAENRCLDVPKGSQSCDTLQAPGIQKKTEAVTTVNMGEIESGTKNSGAPKKVEDWCDSPSTSNVASERKQSAKKLPTSGCALKTKNSMSKIIDKAVETTSGKKVPSKLTSGYAARTQYPASKIVDKAAVAATDKDVLSKPTSANAVTTKHSAKGIVDKAAEATTDKEALGKSTSNDAVEARHPASEIVDKAAKRPTNREALGTPLNVACSSTLLSEHNMAEDQADSLAGSKTAAASPHDGESLKQAQESSVVSSPSCDVLTDTSTPAVHEADHTSGMLPHGTNSHKSPPDNATLATGHCVSLGTSKGASTFGSPLQESACSSKPSLTQQSDDSSASVIRQVSSCEQPRKENPVPLDPPAIYEATKQGDGNESASACDNFSTQQPVEGTGSSQGPPPGEAVDKRHDSTASTEESDQWTGEQSSPSPPRQTDADSPTTAGSSNGDAGDCKPNPHTEGPATSSHQDKVIKPRPPKKKSKNKGPGTNTSMRSSWLFNRKKRGKRRHSSTDSPSGSSPKKSKAADASQGSSDSPGEPSARPIKKEPADDVGTEAMLPSVAPPGHCSNKKRTSCAGQAFRSTGPKSTGSSAERFEAADPSQDVDSVAQGSSSRKLTGEPRTSAVKKEPGTEGVVDTEAIQNTPGKPRILTRLVSPVVQASDGSPSPACSAKSPAAGGKPSDPSSSSDSASAATPATPYETALMDLDMFTGLSILDVCGSGTEMLAELREQLQVRSITKKQAVGVVQKAVHEAVLDECLKRERADRTLKLLAQVPFSLDPAKVAKIEQLTRAIVETSEVGSKP